MLSVLEVEGKEKTDRVHVHQTRAPGLGKRGWRQTNGLGRQQIEVSGLYLATTDPSHKFKQVHLYTPVDLYGRAAEQNHDKLSAVSRE